jgi:hypothetical protein
MHIQLCPHCGQFHDLRARHTSPADCLRDWPKTRFAPPVRSSLVPFRKVSRVFRL